MVLVIRTDLDMTKGKVAAQCCHAALSAYQAATEQSDQTRAWLRTWERAGQTKVTLKCPSETAMLDMQAAARRQGLVARSICDAGRTQIAAGSRTVLAIGPAPASMVDRVSGSLKLY
ncbi:peptidyl-tRNA hydrolase [Entophlyctis helioformis]|nr:peptidyl-tRNA hydrolase [Entophlyctis helioformis]KAI8922841.1 peptidyl-tRNA hydrolase [Entophlyctis helioformis]